MLTTKNSEGSRPCPKTTNAVNRRISRRRSVTLSEICQKIPVKNSANWTPGLGAPTFKMWGPARPANRFKPRQEKKRCGKIGPLALPPPFRQPQLIFLLDPRPIPYFFSTFLGLDTSTSRCEEVGSITTRNTKKTTAKMADTSLLDRKYFDGIYIPAGLIVFGTAILKSPWLPYAVALAVLLGSLKFYRLQPKKFLKPDAFQELVLKEKTILSHNVAIYRFELPQPNSILGLPIGQHISIGAHLPQPDGASKEIVRSYTPVSGDHQPGYVDLLIKSYPQGNISRHMASLAVGQTIRVKGPKGAFVYTPNMVRHFGMIAGGTGITPMLQVIRAIIRGRKAGDRTEVDLIFANVTKEDILLKEDLDALAAEDKGFRVHYVLDKPPADWQGGVGYVTADMINKWLPKAADDVKILLCGPPPMVSGLKKTTESLGFKKARPVSKLEDQVFAF
ncbi:hypothetical protein QBC38DRAFT_466054 [Podospora fimiseda]|uniref:NADH-cytochrome b5 reductase 1 n=1 Tax=Podospora fimiseda TaxID=252190 RepID=A0AAN7H595_9PEZI|nr:hypothetical protein QBC38DRAFT_466054 [Podospora fimiseda]